MKPANDEHSAFIVTIAMMNRWREELVEVNSGIDALKRRKAELDGQIKAAVILGEALADKASSDVAKRADQC